MINPNYVCQSCGAKAYTMQALIHATYCPGAVFPHYVVAQQPYTHSGFEAGAI